MLSEDRGLKYESHAVGSGFRGQPHLPSIDGASHLFERSLELTDVVVFPV